MPDSPPTRQEFMNAINKIHEIARQENEVMNQLRVDVAEMKANVMGEKDSSKIVHENLQANINKAVTDAEAASKRNFQRVKWTWSAMVGGFSVVGILVYDSWARIIELEGRESAVEEIVRLLCNTQGLTC